MNDVSDRLREHYETAFEKFGPTSEGVDWGSDPQRVAIRYDRMLDVLSRRASGPQRLLDVGCGYGGLLSHAIQREISVDYTGIDVAENMIEWARANHSQGKFLCADIINAEDIGTFDFAVCNGILTQKLGVPGLDMDRFAHDLIRRMFEISTAGIAFNVMTTKVNYFSNNLYYRNPIELLGWCMSEVTPHVRLDHSYPLYEYTLYLYREPQ